MDTIPNGPIPDSLRYTDGNYVPERMPWVARAQTLRARRIGTRTLHAIHKPWFIVRLPHGVGVLTTTGRKTGKARRTYIKAVQDGDKGVSGLDPGRTSAVAQEHSSQSLDRNTTDERDLRGNCPGASR